MPPRKKKTTKNANVPTGLPLGSFEVIRNRIKEFKLSMVDTDEGYAVDATDLYESLKCYGVVLYKERTNEKKFRCLCSAKCTQDKVTLNLNQKWEGDKMVWVSSNATRHLSEQHNILTRNSEKRLKKVQDEEQYRHEMLHSFRHDMKRLGELQWAKMVLLCRLPFLFTTLAVVRDTMHYTCIETMTKNISRNRIVHLCTEIYSQVMGCIKRMMLDTIEAHGMRVFSVNVDNWKSENSTRHFMGMRIYFMDKFFELQTFLLGMREFDPSSAMRDGALGQRNSMNAWGKGLLKTYGLAFENVFSGTTDKANDVRVLCQQDMNAYWEWCPPHMINCGLYYTFGDRNPEMKQEVAYMRENIATIRNLTKKGTLFDEKKAELNPEAAKKELYALQDQRFMGVFMTMVRYYELFETINDTLSVANLANPVSLSKLELVQLISILAPLREISVKCQVQSEAYGYRILQKIINERLEGSLNEKRPVKNYFCQQELFTSFTHRVALTRRLMIEGIDLKFFKRYFEMSRVTKTREVVFQPYLLEAQNLLHPAFRNLDPVYLVINELVTSESVAIRKWLYPVKKKAKKMKNGGREYLNARKADYIKQVQKLVTAAIKKNIIDTIIQSKPEEPVPMETWEDAQPQHRSLNMTSVEQSVFEKREEQPSSSRERSCNRSIFDLAGSEFETYLTASQSDSSFIDTSLVCNVSKWMQKIGQYKFQLIIRAMVAFFGVPTSSSGIELDFYFSGLLLNKQRMSMASDLIEIVHMLDRNRRLIDLVQVDVLTKASAKLARPIFCGDDYLPDKESPEEDLSRSDSDHDYAEPESSDEEEQGQSTEAKQRQDAERQRRSEMHQQQEDQFAEDELKRRQESLAKETAQQKKKDELAKKMEKEREIELEKKRLNKLEERKEQQRKNEVKRRQDQVYL